MVEESKILRLRVLLMFLQADTSCTVTGISRTLDVSKQTISRIIMELEQEGFIDRSNVRKPKLTSLGFQVANMYAEKIRISMNHLMYEGVSIDHAKHDAYFWALFNSENTMDVIRSSEKRFRVKYELRDQRKFSGLFLSKMLEDGKYTLPFIMYRENIKDGSIISVVDDLFEHPCLLTIKNKKGFIQLRMSCLMRQLENNNELLRCNINNLQYFDNGIFVNAEKSGDTFTIPLDVLHFINMGKGMSQVFHGTVCCKINYDLGENQGVKVTSFLTILI